MRKKSNKTSIILKTILVFTILNLFSSCKFIFKESVMFNYLEENFRKMKTKNSIFELTELTEQKFDDIFIFMPETKNHEINTAIGYKYLNDDLTQAVEDERRKIIILKNGIVIFEDNYWNYQIEFEEFKNDLDSNDRYKFLPYTKIRFSKFKVKKSTHNVTRAFYSLTPVK